MQSTSTEAVAARTSVQPATVGGGSIGSDLLRVGIIGAGLVSPFHSAAIRGCPGAVLAAVCDPRGERAREIADGAPVFGDWQELLRADVVDAVVVAVPHHLHHEVATAFGARGVHVLLEKPMATSVAECERIVRSCDDGGAVLALAHLQRFLPANTATRGRVAAGEIGRVRLLVDRRTSQYEPDSRPEWFFDPVRAGGGIVMNVGIHCIDRIHYLTGARTVAVSAVTSQPPGVQVETEAAIILHLDDDSNAVLSLTGTGGLSADRTEIVGDKGSIVVEHQVAGAFRRPEEGGGGTGGGVADAFGDQLADFLSAIRDGGSPVASGADGLLALRTTLASYRAASTGRTVEVSAV